MLYSPGSMMQPSSVRQARVDLLLKDLEELEQETEDTLVSHITNTRRVVD